MYRSQSTALTWIDLRGLQFRILARNFQKLSNINEASSKVSSTRERKPRMKFTDGYWQMRPGMTPHYAAQVHEVTVEQDALTVYAPIGKLQERGHTVNQPLLTVCFSSPMENVIRVQLRHHKGANRRKPEFTIYSGPHPQVSISDDEQRLTLTSGNLSVRINKTEDWLVEYIGGDKVLTSSGWRALGFVDTPMGVISMSN